MTPSPSPDPRNEDACRQAAALLQRDHPRWLVMWGCYTRRYVAFPLFRAPHGTVLTAATPGEMAEQMRRAERTQGGPGQGRPGQGRPGPQDWPGRR